MHYILDHKLGNHLKAVLGKKKVKAKITDQLLIEKKNYSEKLKHLKNSLRILLQNSNPKTTHTLIKMYFVKLVIQTTTSHRLQWPIVPVTNGHCSQ